MGHAGQAVAARGVLPCSCCHSEQRAERASYIGGDYVHPLHMVHDSDDRSCAVLS